MCMFITQLKHICKPVSKKKISNDVAKCSV